MFTPTREEAERAARMIAAYEQAGAERGVGAIVIDDQMVDAASLRLEWKRLAIARRAGVL
ncbi:MAG TPA: hypothetical protein VKC57_10445, partial [Ktedonobacterales bacterium]|nr:hypothetical protein [Ktedonobacterales bacterium]